MHKYELMLLLPPDLGEKGTENAIGTVKELLDSFGGEIFHEDVWGVRDLAYTIKKHDQGYYIVWNLDFPGKHVSELEQALNINPEVLRYLLVKTPPNYEIKTLDQYLEEAKKAQEEAEKEKEESNARPAKTRKPAAKKAEKTAPKKESKEEVDAKLKSIIDDPDISL